MVVLLKHSMELLSRDRGVEGSARGRVGGRDSLIMEYNLKVVGQ